MSTNIATAVIANVDRILAEREVDRNWLASALGISQPSVSNMLSKKKPMLTTSIEKLAAALEVDVCDLLCPASGKKPAKGKK